MDFRQYNAFVFFDHPAGGRTATTRASDEEWAKNACASIFGAHGAGCDASKLTDLNFVRADASAQSARYRFGWGRQTRLSKNMEDLHLPKLEERLRMPGKIERNFGAPGCLALVAARASASRGLEDVRYASAASLLSTAEGREPRSEEDAAAAVCALLWASPAERLEYLWAHGCAFAQNHAQLTAAAAPLGLESELLGVAHTPSDGDAQLLRARLSLPPELLTQLSTGRLLLPDQLRDLPWSESALATCTRDPGSVRGHDLEESALLLRWPHVGHDPASGAALRVATPTGTCELEARTPRVRVSRRWCVQSVTVVGCRKRRSAARADTECDAGERRKEKKFKAALALSRLAEDTRGEELAERLRLIHRTLRGRKKKKEDRQPGAARSDSDSVLSEEELSSSSEEGPRSRSPRRRAHALRLLEAGAAIKKEVSKGACA